MGKRKDNKGRVLKFGESQRENGSYMYRYTDTSNKRRYVYAPTLDELRQKETEIQRDIADGIDPTGAEITVIELLKKYAATKQYLSQNTQEQYYYAVCTLSKEPFMQRRVNTIKLSDAKAFIMKLRNDGRKYSTIQSFYAKLRPAFEMAVDDDLIRKNPFKFKLSDIIPNDTEERKPLSQLDKKRLLEFAADYPCYDEVVILLGTGLRVSELCGLTVHDIDFANRKITISKQLLRNLHGEYRVETPKTDSGVRYIPMLNEEVYKAFKRVVQDRGTPKIEMMIDGFTGFLFLNKYGKPKVARNIQYDIDILIKRYNANHAIMMPDFTPHNLRHTFCTDMANKGMNLKTLQYLMGHSDASTTMNTYAACDYELAEKELARVLAIG